MTGASRCVGIDLGAFRIHTVVLTAATGAPARVVEAHAFDGTDLPGLVAMAAGADQIAIDAPDRLSTAAHRGDESRKPKFRSARCAEIALGELRGSLFLGESGRPVLGSGLDPRWLAKSSPEGAAAEERADRGEVNLREVPPRAASAGADCATRH